MKNPNTPFFSFHPFRSVRFNLCVSFCLVLVLGFVYCDRLIIPQSEASKNDAPEHGAPKKMTEKWTYDEIAKKLIFQYCEQPDDPSTPDGTKVFFQLPGWPEIKITI